MQPLDHVVDMMRRELDWFESLRPHQIEAVEAVVNAYKQGVRMVLVDAPTGSGKTVIGETVRRALNETTLYVCNSIELQHQFADSFNAPILKGRANYPTVNRPDLTADHCQGSMCNLCPKQSECPYLTARQAAVDGNPAVLNTSYYLHEANGPGRMSGRGLVIIDEADTLEQELFRWAQFKVSNTRMRQVGMRPPKKGAKWDTLMGWLERYRAACSKLADESKTVLDFAAERRWRSTAAAVRRMFPPDVDQSNWVREYNDSSAFMLKPVTVDRYGQDWLWRHGRKHLLMSATLIGPQQMMRELGWEGEWELVTVPSTFPVENRPVVALPMASMTKTGRESGEWERGVEAVVRLVELHKTDRVLVHTVSYELARMTVEGLRRAGLGGRTVTYFTAAERSRALKKFKSLDGAVMVASSMDRGVDLPGDLCRVQIVLKVPYPDLGDRRVSVRMRLADGRVWYDLQTVRSLVQMTGRGVRSEDDWAVTYVVDREFVKHWGRWRMLGPRWWVESVVLDRRPSTVLEHGVRPPVSVTGGR